MFFSPLEQFIITPVFALSYFVVTNETFFIVLIILLSFFIFNALSQKETNSFYIILGQWQYFFQKIYEFILFTVIKNTNNFRGQFYFPILFSIFFSILLLNLVGLVPNSFALTSHIIITFGMSLSFFIGITTICILKYKARFFSLFLPQNTPFILALLLIPIEVISYFFKPLSLSIRLFANLMAGHALMHVIAGFGYLFLNLRSVAYVLQYIPVLIISALFLLDVAVCTIQAFVFTILICIYLNDALNLH